ncbi:MAG: efflux RND transporter periplasmic adaptor subunit [Pseudorhizobium sp.]
MSIWKQLLLSIVALVGALCLWVYLVPSAGDTLASAGVPTSWIAAIRPEAEPSGDGGASPRGGQGGRGGGQGAQATLIATRPVEIGTVNDRLSAIGDGEAIQSVVVMPQATGTIEEILVSSGERVTKGQVLARLDDDEQTILRDQAQVLLRSASEKASSYRNAQSFARLDILDAQIAQETAQLDLTNAELALKRRAIVAPIDGTVGIVAVNIGDNVTTTSTVVSIDNRSELLVDFWAPERFAIAVKPGMPVEASSVSRPGEVFNGTVEAVDNRVDTASRTIRIRAKIPNANDALRAGMSFNVTMRFAGERFPAVDPLAVQWDSQGSFVWQVREDKSVKTRVRIVQRNPDAVLVEAELAEGDSVVTEGLQRVREGGTVRIAGQPAPEVASK